MTETKYMNFPLLSSCGKMSIISTLQNVKSALLKSLLPCPGQESVETPFSGQASTPGCDVSASVDPQGPVRRPSEESQRPSDESDRDTKDSSSERSTELAQTSSPSRPATPELNDMPNERFRSESPTDKLGDEPPQLVMPVLPMKCAFKLKLLK